MDLADESAGLRSMDLRRVQRAASIIILGMEYIHTYLYKEGFTISVHDDVSTTVSLWLIAAPLWAISWSVSSLPRHVHIRRGSSLSIYSYIYTFTIRIRITYLRAFFSSWITEITLSCRLIFFKFFNPLHSPLKRKFICDMVKLILTKTHG